MTRMGGGLQKVGRRRDLLLPPEIISIETFLKNKKKILREDTLK